MQTPMLPLSLSFSSWAAPWGPQSCLACRRWQRTCSRAGAAGAPAARRPSGRWLPRCPGCTARVPSAGSFELGAGHAEWGTYAGSALHGSSWTVPTLLPPASGSMVIIALRPGRRAWICDSRSSTTGSKGGRGCRVKGMSTSSSYGACKVIKQRRPLHKHFHLLLPYNARLPLAAAASARRPR